MNCHVCSDTCVRSVRQGTHQYWRCSLCGTHQLLPQPSQEELKRFYASYHMKSCEGINYEQYESRVSADFPSKVQLAKRCTSSPAGSLLDVGCGKGFFVRAALASGFAAKGIDLSGTAIEFARKDLGLDVVQGTIEESITGWQASFDVITCWATIEHVADPRATLGAMYACLRPGGILLLDTGLCEASFESLLPGHNQWFDAPEHLFVFSKQGLQRLLTETGFRITHLDTNFDRSALRQTARWLYHVGICTASFLMLRPMLRAKRFRKMQLEAKWPIGRLISICAEKQ